MDEKTVRVLKAIIVILFIGLPILVMFYDLALGGFFLIPALYGVHRGFAYLGSRHLEFDEVNQFHNTNSAGKTILVQIVDDFGRELPPQEVANRMAEARAKAGPKDNVIAANFKVDKSNNS